MSGGRQPDTARCTVSLGVVRTSRSRSTIDRTCVVQTPHIRKAGISEPPRVATLAVVDSSSGHTLVWWLCGRFGLQLYLGVLRRQVAR